MSREAPPYRIIQGNCLDVLRGLETESVDCCVTSSPYWGLRSYGTEPQVWGGDPACLHDWTTVTKHRSTGGPQVAQTKWRTCGSVAVAQQNTKSDFCRLCNAWKGELGLEPHPELFIEHLVLVFREVRRVLKPEGTLWANIGDCYATGAGKVGECPGGGEQGSRWAGQHPGRMKQNGLATNSGAAMGPMIQPNRMPIPGLKPKDLVMIPARLALALQGDGWWLRQDNIWAKRNCMPESVQDRCTTSHEHVFHFAKSEKYYYDAGAIMEPLTTAEGENYPARARITGRGDQGFAAARGRDRGKSGGFPPSWKGSRFDTNRKLSIHPNIQKRSGNKERKYDVETRPNNHQGTSIPWEGSARNHRSVWFINTTPFPGAHFAVMPQELARTCILAGCPRGGVVLDPFGGAGTTLVTALENDRAAISIELNPKYVRMQHRRVLRTLGMKAHSPDICVDEPHTDLPLFSGGCL